MNAGSLIGFGALTVVLLTALSLIATAVVGWTHRRMLRAGPAAERSAAAWALLTPIALAFSSVLVLAALGSRGVDHCVGHEHHAHFCLVHGAVWLHRPWAVAIAAAAAITFVMRLAAVMWRRLRARSAIGQLRRVADTGDGVRIATSDRVFCFVTGLRRPEVFMSSRAWHALSIDERAAVIAHEHAHAAHGDLWLGGLLDAAAVLAAPLCGSWLHARWSDASERLCDIRAAAVTSRADVASALVKMCRAGQPQFIPAGFTPASDTLEHRVRAVLSSGNAGSGLGAVAWALLVGAIVTTALLETPLHHALETLLG